MPGGASRALVAADRGTERTLPVTRCGACSAPRCWPRRWPRSRSRPERGRGVEPWSHGDLQILRAWRARYRRESERPIPWPSVNRKPSPRNVCEVVMSHPRITIRVLSGDAGSSTGGRGKINAGRKAAETALKSPCGHTLPSSRKIIPVWQHVAREATRSKGSWVLRGVKELGVVTVHPSGNMRKHDSPRAPSGSRAPGPWARGTRRAKWCLCTLAGGRGRTALQWR